MDGTLTGPDASSAGRTPLAAHLPGRDQYLRVQRDSFRFFLEMRHPDTGLVLDCTRPGCPSSIAAVGFFLSVLPSAVERGWLARDAAVSMALQPLRFLDEAPQDGARDGTGYRGFYYHFLDPGTGRRAWKSELSTIDTTLLLAGALTAATYFDGRAVDERELRRVVGRLYRRVEWDWALAASDGQDAGRLPVSMGWTPERGFLRYRWEGYNEGILLYALALGSPTHPIPRGSYAAFTRTYRWRQVYGIEYLYSGPLFVHQYPHLWIDFRGIQDHFMAGHGIDYFENSRRAIEVHHAYAVRNPRGFVGYGPRMWGVTASDGPGPEIRSVGGRSRRFWDYRARGAPFGPDDGTLAPWAVVASLPFAPDLVESTLDHLARLHADVYGRYGLRNSFNPTMSESTPGLGWNSRWHFALNQGPVVMAVENHETGLVWKLMRSCVPLRNGLLRMGFQGGWLEGRTPEASEEAERLGAEG